MIKHISTYPRPWYVSQGRDLILGTRSLARPGIGAGTFGIKGRSVLMEERVHVALFYFLVDRALTGSEIREVNSL